MSLSVSDPAGRKWRISRRLFHPPRIRRRQRPSVSVPDAIDVVGNTVPVAEGLAGVVFVIAILIGVRAIVEFWPIIVFVIELVVLTALGGVHALLGRRIVMAESDGDVWTWTVKGRSASVRLAASVARAVREGAAFPPGGRVETGSRGGPV
jgi:hypothetical protein